MRSLKGTQRAWRLASTSVGGRLRIARNPNQGSSAVGSENTGKKTFTNPLSGVSLKHWKADLLESAFQCVQNNQNAGLINLNFSVSFKHQRLEALADTPALERDRIT